MFNDDMSKNNDNTFFKNYMRYQYCSNRVQFHHFLCKQICNIIKIECIVINIIVGPIESTQKNKV